MKIRGTQASPWWSLAIFLHEVNQANDRLPLTNVASEFSFSVFSPLQLLNPQIKTRKLLSSYLNWIDGQKWQLQKENKVHVHRAGSFHLL